MAPAQQLPEKAPPLANYPTPEDAEYARQQGFGYGDPNESYIQGNAARVIGSQFNDRKSQPWIPQSARGKYDDEAALLANDDRESRNLDLTNPDNAPYAESMGTQLAQAALAAKRSPVAALGFDPSRAAFDIRMPVTDKPSFAGSYMENGDSIYSNAAYPSTILHESMHRGLKQLKADPALAELFKSLPSKEEHLVRYLMATQAGDPEAGRGEISDQQRTDAKYIYGGSGLYKKQLEAIDYAAQEAIKNRRPGGPR